METPSHGGNLQLEHAKSFPAFYDTDLPGSRSGLAARWAAMVSTLTMSQIPNFVGPCFSLPAYIRVFLSLI